MWIIKQILQSKRKNIADFWLKRLEMACFGGGKGEGMPGKKKNRVDPIFPFFLTQHLSTGKIDIEYLFSF